jgi:hypothetical protein
MLARLISADEESYSLLVGQQGQLHWILSGRVLHVGIVVGQLGFFNKYMYLAYPY